MYQQTNTKQLQERKKTSLELNYGLYDFQDRNKLVRSLSNKIQEQEYLQKNGRPYKFGNNEDLIGVGQQLLEFFFFDYMINKGYPNPTTQIKKMGDIIQMRQKLLQEKQISELAVFFKVHQYIQVGKQVGLKTNPKVQAETFKAILGAHYYDKQFDLDLMREFLAPIFQLLLEKNQHFDLNDVKVNSKSQFYEFLNEHQEYKPKVQLEWRRISQFDGTAITEFNYEMNVNDDPLLSGKVTGNNKKETEHQLYKKMLLVLKNDVQGLQQQSQKKQNSRNQNLDDSAFLMDDDQLADTSHNFHDIQSELLKEDKKNQNQEFNIDKMLDNLINQ